MVQNFEFKGGYGVYKLRPHVGRSKMTNWLHASPVVKESMVKEGSNKGPSNFNSLVSIGKLSIFNNL